MQNATTHRCNDLLSTFRLGSDFNEKDGDQLISYRYQVNSHPTEQHIGTIPPENSDGLIVALVTKQE